MNSEIPFFDLRNRGEALPEYTSVDELVEHYRRVYPLFFSRMAQIGLRTSFTTDRARSGWEWIGERGKAISAAPIASIWPGKDQFTGAAICGCITRMLYHASRKLAPSIPATALVFRADMNGEKSIPALTVREHMTLALGPIGNRIPYNTPVLDGAYSQVNHAFTPLQLFPYSELVYNYKMLSPALTYDLEHEGENWHRDWFNTSDDYEWANRALMGEM